MSIDERLSFFHELINCNYNVYMWTYDDAVKLVETNCPAELETGDTITLLNFEKALLQHANTKEKYPILLVTNFGIVWIAAYEFRESKLYRIHVLGPAFTGKDSSKSTKKKLDSYNISMKLQRQMEKQIDNVQIIPTTTLLQLAVMLHYSITSKQISVLDVAYSTNGDIGKFEEPEIISEEHQGIWTFERQFLNMVREGNPDYKKILEKSITLSSGVKAELGDTLRQHKNNTHVLLTLCSRAAMEGGLLPSVAYSLNDYYAKVIEECRNLAETSATAHSIVEDFVQRVRKSKENLDISGPIMEICEYIITHVKDKLTLTELAERVGYSEYYLSHKFKEETGENIKDYIRRKKINEAKLLLAGTKMSVLEISLELSFGNRSYFYSCFQKETGLSPTQYRSQNYKS